MGKLKAADHAHNNPTQTSAEQSGRGGETILIGQTERWFQGIQTSTDAMPKRMTQGNVFGEAIAKYQGTWLDEAIRASFLAVALHRTPI
jgi:hypothetical protein